MSYFNSFLTFIENVQFKSLVRVIFWEYHEFLHELPHLSSRQKLHTWQTQRGPSFLVESFLKASAVVSLFIQKGSWCIIIYRYFTMSTIDWSIWSDISQQLPSFVPRKLGLIIGRCIHACCFGMFDVGYDCVHAFHAFHWYGILKGHMYLSYEVISSNYCYSLYLLCAYRQALCACQVPIHILAFWVSIG